VKKELGVYNSRGHRAISHHKMHLEASTRCTALAGQVQVDRPLYEVFLKLLSMQKDVQLNEEARLESENAILPSKVKA
jgi:hypothetical protein